MGLKPIIAGAGALVTTLTAAVVVTREDPVDLSATSPAPAATTSDAAPVTNMEVPPGAVSTALPPLMVSLAAEVPTGGELRDDILFCLPGALPKPRCMAQAEIMEFGDRPVVGTAEDGTPRYGEVTLVHPTDYDLPERDVRTCRVFGELRADGWGGMTSAAMAREAAFVRFCGLVALAARATAPRTTPFDGDTMSMRELESVPRSDWPEIGPAREGDRTAPVFTEAELGARRWSAALPSTRLDITEVALADFDGDGVAERLLYIGGRARGGSAGFSGYYLMQMTPDGVRLREVGWS